MLEILLFLSPQEIESQGWHFASQTLKIVVQLQVLAQILVSCPRPAERLEVGAGLDQRERPTTRQIYPHCSSCAHSLS